MKPMQRTRGFTLIELLVVLVIFGLISVMAYGGLNAVLQTRAAVDTSLDRTARLQKAWMRLREDLQLVRPRAVRDAFGSLRAPVIGVREPRLEFTRGGWRNPMLAPRAGLERVSYSLDDQQLIRESFRVLDQAQDSKPVKAVLLDRVKELRLRYLDNNREWRDEWPPPSSTGATADAAKALPPRAIEITLTTEPEGELKFLFAPGLDPLPQGFVPGSEVTGTGGPGAGRQRPVRNDDETPVTQAPPAPEISGEPNP